MSTQRNRNSWQGQKYLIKTEWLDAEDQWGPSLGPKHELIHQIVRIVRALENEQNDITSRALFVISMSIHKQLSLSHKNKLNFFFKQVWKLTYNSDHRLYSNMRNHPRRKICRLWMWCLMRLHGSFKRKFYNRISTIKMIIFFPNQAIR